MAKTPTKSTTTKKPAAPKKGTAPAATKAPEPITSERVTVYIPEETAAPLGLEEGHYEADKVTKSDGSTDYIVLNAEGTPIGTFQDLMEDDGTDEDAEDDQDEDLEEGDATDSQANVGPVTGTLETTADEPAEPIAPAKPKKAASKADLTADKVAEGFKSLSDALKATSKDKKMPRQLRWALKSLDAAQDQVMRYLETL